MRTKDFFKRTFMIVLLALFMGAPAFGKVDLRVMTFNVPMNKFSDQLNSWANRCVGLHAFFDSVKPDVVGMQEPLRAELMDLLSGMPDYSMLGRARDDGKESGEYCAVLYNTKRLLVEASGTYWLSTTPEVVSRNWNSAYIRVATWAVFRDKETKARFMFTNTHLDNVSDSARSNQMKVLKEQMQILMTTYGNMPAIVTGDFNIKTSGAAYNQAKTYLIPMKDAYKVAKSKEGPTVTFPSGKGKKIDYIMLTNDITCDKAWIHDSNLSTGLKLSDHNAHYADVNFEQTDEEVGDSIVEVAKQMIDNTLTFTETNKSLIANATNGDANCQLSCDKLKEDGGYDLNAAIDGNFSTYVQSDDKIDNDIPNAPHYIQADLQRNDVRSFRLRYARRNHPRFGPVDRWQDVLIQGSNDGTNWDYITELHDFGGADMKYYYSDNIVMHKAYRYLRFNVMHTPAMNLRNSNPQFSLGEFQLLLSEINTTSSQQLNNADVKSAVAALQTAIDSVEANNNAANRTALIEAMNALEALKVPMDLNDIIAAAQDAYDAFTAGTALGQTSVDERNALLEAINAAKSASTIDDMRSQKEALAKALALFKSTVVRFESNKWYYVLNHTYTDGGTTRADNNGQALKAASENVGDSLVYGGASDYEFTETHNPYSQWRLIPVDESQNIYSVQNRAHGFYLGLVDDKTNQFTLSQTAVPYYVEITGAEDVHFSPVEYAGKDNPYVTTAVGNSEIVAGNGSRCTNSAWNLKAVETDSTLKYVEYSLQKNKS